MESCLVMTEHTGIKGIFPFTNAPCFMHYRYNIGLNISYLTEKDWTRHQTQLLLKMLQHHMLNWGHAIVKKVVIMWCNVIKLSDLLLLYEGKKRNILTALGINASCSIPCIFYDMLLMSLKIIQMKHLQSQQR